MTLGFSLNVLVTHVKMLSHAVTCKQDMEKRCRFMQMTEYAVKPVADDQDYCHPHTHTHRGDAVNLSNNIEATRGEKTSRLSATHKSLSLALFHFNISSIQTEPLPLSWLAICWPPHLVGKSFQAAENWTLIYGQGSRDKSIPSLFFSNSICITSVEVLSFFISSEKKWDFSLSVLCFSEWSQSAPTGLDKLQFPSGINEAFFISSYLNHFSSSYKVVKTSFSSFVLMYV